MIVKRFSAVPASWTSTRQNSSTIFPLITHAKISGAINWFWELSSIFNPSSGSVGPQWVKTSLQNQNEATIQHIQGSSKGLEDLLIGWWGQTRGGDLLTLFPQRPRCASAIFCLDQRSLTSLLYVLRHVTGTKHLTAFRGCSYLLHLTFTVSAVHRMKRIFRFCIFTYSIYASGWNIDAQIKSYRCWKCLRFAVLGKRIKAMLIKEKEMDVGFGSKELRISWKEF